MTSTEEMNKVRKTNHSGNPLPSQVKRLGLVSLFNDFASEMVVPLLPAFVTTVLGLGPQVLGIMEGIAESATSILKYFAGWWSDRIARRKPLAVSGYAVANLVRPLMAFATAGWQLVVIRFADRVGKGMRTAPRDALLAEATDPDQRGRAFGFHRAMDHAGALIGPVVALALLGWLHMDLSTVFLLSAVPGVAAILSMLMLVKEQAPRQCEGESVQMRECVTDRRDFHVFISASVLFTLGNSSDTFLVLRGHELGLPVVLAPVFWIVLHFSKAATATHGGMLSDRIGRKKTIFLGWVLYAGCYLGFAAASALWQLFALLLLYGLSYGLTEGTEKALVADIIRPDRRGRGYGIYHLAVGAAALPASVLTGMLWQAYGPRVALGIGAGLALAAAWTLLLGFRGARSQG
jgi:MFS family permease